MRKPFYLQGTIFALGSNGTDNILTVTVVHGNAQVKQYIGTNMTLIVPQATLMYKITQMEDEDTTPNKVPITFAELQVGQKVAIHGNVVNGVFTTRLITVYIKAPEVETVTIEP
jgi:hypothetical protein